MPRGIYKKTEEHKRKISEALRGRVLSREHKRSLSKAMKGNPGYWLGKKFSEEHKRKIVKNLLGGGWNKGNKMSEEFKRRASELQRGERNSNWQGGISFEPYSPKFNNTLKAQIKERDNYICRQCSQTREQSNYWLIVHHIDYDKKNCEEDNLITLCISCHIKANYNRANCVSYFMEEIE